MGFFIQVYIPGYTLKYLYFFHQDLVDYIFKFCYKFLKSKLNYYEEGALKWTHETSDKFVKIFFHVGGLTMRELMGNDCVFFCNTFEHVVKQEVDRFIDEETIYLPDEEMIKGIHISRISGVGFATAMSHKLKRTCGALEAFTLMCSFDPFLMDLDEYVDCNSL